MTFGCQFSSRTTKTQLISAGILDDYILAECLILSLLHHLLFSSTILYSIYSQTVAKKPAITIAGYAILLNLTQFLDHVEKSMNNLILVETEAVAQRHQSLFSRPRPIREKGVACESRKHNHNNILYLLRA